MESQAAMVEVIEEGGLPPVCCTIASVETRNMKLGNLLVDAIKLQRDRKNPEKNVWEIEDKMVDDITDLPGYYTDKIVERVKTVQEGLDSEEAVLEEDEKTGILRVKMDGLKDDILDIEEISKPVAQSEERSNSPRQRRSPRKPTSSKAIDTKKKSRTKTDPGVIDADSGGKSRRSGSASSEEAQSYKPAVQGKEQNNPSRQRRSPIKSTASKVGATKKKSRTKTDPGVMDADNGGKSRRSGSAGSDDGQTNNEPPLSSSDFSAVDDLVCDELGMERPQRPMKPSVSIPPPYKPPKKKDGNTPSTGKTYPISTEPETIAEGVKRSTVFSGLVEDVDGFMKDNFGYDIKEKGDIPSPEGKKTMTFDVRTLAEQEAVEFADASEDMTFDLETQEEPLSVEDVIQSAIGKGVDPTELKRLIESLPSAKSTERSKLRSRLRQGRYNK